MKSKKSKHPLDDPNQKLLFDVPAYDGVGEMKRWMKVQFAINPCFRPTAKQMLEIADKFHVRGRRPLEVYEEIIDEFQAKYEGWGVTMLTIPSDEKKA